MVGGGGGGGRRADTGHRTGRRRMARRGKGRRGNEELVVQTTTDAPLMKESIDFLDFWDWVPERERMPEMDDWERVP